MSDTATAPPDGAGKGPTRVIIDQLQQQFQGFPVPDGKFDPSTVRPDQLREFGLPPRPDPERQPLLRTAWNRGFGKAMTLKPFVFRKELLEAVQYRPVPKSPDIMPIGQTRFETSSNWSGTYITANQDRQFLQVWGLWKIPDNLKLPPPLLQGPANVPYICSNWIGLDGQRLYYDSSLPQIGTACTLTNGPPKVEAWTQWWARDNTSTAPLPIGLTVAPGNEVLCVMTAMDPQTVVFVMVNLSTSPPEGMAIKGSAPAVPSGGTVRPEIAGATAQWIVERPEVVGQTIQCNFPDYGRTEFDLCIAVEGNSVDIFSWFTGLPQVLHGDRLIRMFQELQSPARTQFVSMPHKLNDMAVKVSYGGF